MVVKTEGIGANPTNADQGAQGVYEVQSGETLGKIALKLASDFGMPIGTPAERKASIRAVLNDIYRLNPRFNPELESDGTVNFDGWNPEGAGVKTQDPDAIMRGEKINIPQARPQVEATETADRDRVDTERHGPEPISNDGTNANDALSPEAVNRERERRTENTPTTQNAPATENAPTTENAAPTTENAAPTTENAPATEDAPEEPSKFEKIFGPIRKLFKNPMFQGLMAVLNLIPGLNVIVSGVCAIIGLTNIISKIAQGKGMDVLKNPLELGSTLGYIAGVFMPGLGAIGGLFGMLQSMKESGTGENQEQPAKQPAKGRRDRQRTPRTEGADGATPASEQVPAMSNEELTALVGRVRTDLPNALTGSRFAEWVTDVGRARQQYNLLMQRAMESSPDQVAQDTPAFRDLTEFLNGELPNAVAAQAGQLAFGLGELQVSDTPQPGRLCRVPQTMTIADYAKTVPGFDGRDAQLAQAIASYNGLTELRPDEPVPQNYVLYIPPTLPATNGEWPRFMPMASNDPYGVRPRLEDTYAQLRQIQSEEAILARQLIELVLQMPPPPAPMPEPSASDQPPA